MSKNHRGKGIRELFSRGLGLCTVCNRNNVKILYEHDSGGEKIKICKICRASIKNKTKALAPAPAAVETPAPVTPAPAVTETPASAEPAVEEAPAEEAAAAEAEE